MGPRMTEGAPDVVVDSSPAWAPVSRGDDIGVWATAAA